MLTKVHLVKAMFFPVDMYGCESWTIKKSWVLKNWCSWTVVLERILQSPLDCKELQPVHPKGNLSWIFIGRTDAEAETPVLWPPDVKNWLIGKDPDTGKGWRQEKGMTEDKMVGWHHWLDRHEFEQALGVGDGQESLVCCSLCGHKESSDMTEQLNWTELKALNLPTSSDSCLLLRPFSPCVQSCWSSLLLEHDRLGPFSWPLHLWYFPLGVLSLLIFAWRIPSHYVSLNSDLNFWGRLTLTSNPTVIVCSLPSLIILISLTSAWNYLARFCSFVLIRFPL